MKSYVLGTLLLIAIVCVFACWCNISEVWQFFLNNKSTLLAGFVWVVGVLGPIFIGIREFYKGRRDRFVNEMLIESFLAVERATSMNFQAFGIEQKHYTSRSDQWNIDLENALSKLQLLAPVEIAKLARCYIAAVMVGDEQRKNSITLEQRENQQVIGTKLLEKLRQHLRSELKLKRTDKSILSLRSYITKSNN